MQNNNQVPIWQKANLTLTEAAEYFGVGINKIRELTNGDGSNCVLWIGSKRLIKRRKFEEFLESAYSI